MDKETASIAMQFLNRVEMKGGEVPAFLRVMQVLSQIVDSKPAPHSVALNGTTEIEASGGAGGAAGAS